MRFEACQQKKGFAFQSSGVRALGQQVSVLVVKALGFTGLAMVSMHYSEKQLPTALNPEDEA